MEYQEEFKFLNMESIQRKNASELKEEDRYFLKINVLDKNYNPCSFMIFNKDIMKKLLSTTLVGLQVLTVEFVLSYRNNMWSVNVVDVRE